MEIEAPDTSHADALADLWVDLAASQREHGSHILPAENRERVRESLVRHAVTGDLLVARDNETVIGFASFHQETGAYDQEVDRGVIENLYVVPERRGEGVGSELLAAAEDRLFESGCDVVSLEVMAANDPARAFYRQHGYLPHRVGMERTDSDKTDAG